MLPKTDPANAGSPRWRRGSAVLAVVAAVPLAACGVGAGDGDGGDADSLYAGESVDLVVPYGAGGGYDVYARMMAPYLAECLDAEDVFVQNEPGAGSLVATNATAVADPDEPRLQILNMGGAAASELVEDEGVQYELQEFSHAGRITSAPDLIAAAPDSEFDTWDDVMAADEPVEFVSTGVGSQESITPAVLSAAYDVPVEVVTGFEDSAEARTSVMGGDGDLHALPFDSHQAAYDSEDIHGLVMVSDEPAEYMPDVPLITDFPVEGEAQEVVESMLALPGRVVVGPPDMSEEHLTELQDGFQCAMEDEELLAELDEQQRPADFAPPEEVEEQLDTVFDSNPVFVEAVEEAF